MRRSIVASREILKEERITKDMLSFKRPYNGMCPSNIKKVIGKVANKKIKINQNIKLQFLKNAK